MYPKDPLKPPRAPEMAMGAGVNSQQNMDLSIGTEEYMHTLSEPSDCLGWPHTR